MSPTVAYLNTHGIDTTPSQLMGELENNGYEFYRENSLNHVHSQVIDLFSQEGWVPRLSEEEQKIKERMKWLDKSHAKVDYICRLSQYSNHSDIPVLTKLADQDDLDDQKSAIDVIPDSERMVAGIYFKNLKNIKVKGVQDAIDLRSNKRIDNYRAEINDVTEGVQNGTISEARIERKIDRANKAIEFIDRADYLGTVIAIFSVPAMLIPELNTSLTLLGLAPKASELAIKNHYSWAFISTK